MSITEEMLKEAEKTADTIVNVRNKFDLQKQSMVQMFNPMSSIQPPKPLVPKQKSPRVSSNEGLLSAENESLRQQLAEKDEVIKRVNEKTASAYQVVQDFREGFCKEVEALSEKVFDLQHKVYEKITEE